MQGTSRPALVPSCVKGQAEEVVELKGHQSRFDRIMPSDQKTALITGVTGQDGSYLAELLLSKGYTVHGLVRRSSSFNTERLDHIYEGPQEPNRRLVLHHADLSDGVSLVNLLRDLRPDEVYNLGAQSHV